MSDADYYRARREHAFLLRCEGRSFKEIGERLGITRSAAHMNVNQFSRRVNAAMKNTRWQLLNFGPYLP